MTELPGPVLLAAGGTGGHLFPAEALASALEARGIACELVTDARGERYRARFPGRAVHIVSAATVRGRSPLALARTGLALGRGFLQARRIVARSRPAAFVGFGGYPSLPPAFAALMARVPALVHEQNAVMGRANRLLAPRVACVASGFPLDDAARAQRVETVGNPVRAAVHEAAAGPYVPPQADGRVRLLAFGGSQGARVMAERVPQALARLDEALRARIDLVLQAREEDAAPARAALAAAGIAAEVAPFFEDMPARIARAHLVIARSGASTVSELGVIGRPAILVPFPHAIDDDQARNAANLKAAGGAIVTAQSAFTSDMLADSLARLARDPQRLERMAAGARGAMPADAAERLADLVIAIARKNTKG